MAKQIIWSPLAKEALKDLLISSQERDGNKRCGGALYTLFQNALYRVTLNPLSDSPPKQRTYGTSFRIPTIRFFTGTVSGRLKCLCYGTTIISWAA